MSILVIVRDVPLVLPGTSPGPTGPAGPPGASGLAVVTPQQFASSKSSGVLCDGTDDSPCFVAAIAYLKSQYSTLTNGSSYQASAKLFVPAGKYYLGTTTLDITHTLIIEGEGVGFDGAAYASQLIWAANTTVIRVQRYDTSGASSVNNVTTHVGGDGTTLRSIALKGAFTSTEGEYHGVHAKARVKLDGVRIENFQGDGLFSEAAAGAGAPFEGNANCSFVINCSLAGNRNGMFVSGADVNIWSVIGVDTGNNRRWGIWDQSFLGNSYFGIHSHDNGLNGATGPFATFVTYSGHRYVPKKTGTLTNAPSGTTADNAHWYYVDDSTAGVAWSSGSAATYRDGGSYRSDGGGNANNLFSGCYHEGGQGFAQIDAPALVSGGSMRPNVRGVGSIYGTGFQGKGVSIDGCVIASGTINVGNGQHQIGDGTAAQEVDLRGNGSVQVFAYNGGATVGYLWWLGNEAYLNGHSALHLRAAEADVANVYSTGVDLASGKVLSVNGTQVVTSRQTGTPADATDLATALTLVNALKAKLVAHGLIS